MQVVGGNGQEVVLSAEVRGETEVVHCVGDRHQGHDLYPVPETLWRSWDSGKDCSDAIVLDRSGDRHIGGSKPKRDRGLLLRLIERKQMHTLRSFSGHVSKARENGSVEENFGMKLSFDAVVPKLLIAYHLWVSYCHHVPPCSGKIQCAKDHSIKSLENQKLTQMRNEQNGCEIILAIFKYSCVYTVLGDSDLLKRFIYI